MATSVMPRPLAHSRYADNPGHLLEQRMQERHDEMSRRLQPSFTSLDVAGESNNTSSNHPTSSVMRSFSDPEVSLNHLDLPPTPLTQEVSAREDILSLHHQQKQEFERRRKLLEFQSRPNEGRSISADRSRRRRWRADTPRRSRSLRATPSSSAPTSHTSLSGPRDLVTAENSSTNPTEHSSTIPSDPLSTIPHDPAVQFSHRSGDPPHQHDLDRLPLDFDDPEDPDDPDFDPGPVDQNFLVKEHDDRWILNLSMHFRDHSKREKFFVTYAETPNQWRRVTISLDYRDAPPDSLESELASLTFQRDKSLRIYEALRDSLTEIQYFPTVTNLKLETTPEDNQLHVHVRQDMNEVIHYPPISSFRHVRCPPINESALDFVSHISGFVYRVRLGNRIVIKKEIPGPDSIDEFLYEVNALDSLLDSPNVISLEGLVTDDHGAEVKGLLISYASGGALVDYIFDHTRDVLPWHRREQWARQIVEGLLDIHEAGFVQGDFTLSNIVIDEAQNARIIDINRRGCPVGWEPPELDRLIASGQRIGMCIGVKTDLYQLGMVLWALAEWVDEPEHVARDLRHNIRRNDVPLYYRTIVEYCLNEKPQFRLSAKHLADLFPREASFPPSAQRFSLPSALGLPEGSHPNGQPSAYLPPGPGERIYTDPSKVVTLEEVRNRLRLARGNVQPDEDALTFAGAESTTASTIGGFEHPEHWNGGRRPRAQRLGLARGRSPVSRGRQHLSRDFAQDPLTPPTPTTPTTPLPDRDSRPLENNVIPPSPLRQQNWPEVRPAHPSREQRYVSDGSVAALRSPRSQLYVPDGLAPAIQSVHSQANLPEMSAARPPVATPNFSRFTSISEGTPRALFPEDRPNDVAPSMVPPPTHAPAAGDSLLQPHPHLLDFEASVNASIPSHTPAVNERLLATGPLPLSADERSLNHTTTDVSRLQPAFTAETSPPQHVTPRLGMQTTSQSNSQIDEPPRSNRLETVVERLSPTHIIDSVANTPPPVRNDDQLRPAVADVSPTSQEAVPASERISPLQRDAQFPGHSNSLESAPADAVVSLPPLNPEDRPRDPVADTLLQSPSNDLERHPLSPGIEDQRRPIATPENNPAPFLPLEAHALFSFVPPNSIQPASPRNHVDQFPAQNISLANSPPPLHDNERDHVTAHEAYAPSPSSHQFDPAQPDTSRSYAQSLPDHDEPNEQLHRTAEPDLDTNDNHFLHSDSGLDEPDARFWAVQDDVHLPPRQDLTSAQAPYYAAPVDHLPELTPIPYSATPPTSQPASYPPPPPSTSDTSLPVPTPATHPQANLGPSPSAPSPQTLQTQSPALPPQPAPHPLNPILAPPIVPRPHSSLLRRISANHPSFRPAAAALPLRHDLLPLDWSSVLDSAPNSPMGGGVPLPAPTFASVTTPAERSALSMEWTLAEHSPASLSAASALSLTPRARVYVDDSDGQTERGSSALHRRSEEGLEGFSLDD